MVKRTRDLVAIGLGVAAPAAVAAALIPARDQIGGVNVALVLAVVVVAVAAWGHRPTALLAAASAAVCFDVLHTRPYYSFSITQRNDAITTALLLIVGIAVGELAVWSRKQQAGFGRSFHDQRNFADAEALEHCSAMLHVLLMAAEVRQQTRSVVP